MYKDWLSGFQLPILFISFVPGEHEALLGKDAERDGGRGWETESAAAPPTDRRTQTHFVVAFDPDAAAALSVFRRRTGTQEKINLNKSCRMNGCVWVIGICLENMSRAALALGDDVPSVPL